MIFCQVCTTANQQDAEYCRRCGAKLLIVGGAERWEEPEENAAPRVSLEDHFLERISHLEETVAGILEQMTRFAETLDTIDRNAFVTRSGLSSLVETLRESRLLREDLLYQRWETTMAEQMEIARYRERFTQMKSRFLARYRGEAKKRQSFQALVEEADFLVYSDRFQESLDQLQKALHLDPQNYELAYYMAEIYQQEGMNEKATELLEVALKAKSDHTDSLLMLALLDFDNRSRAEQLLRRCLSVNPVHTTALLSLGAIMVSDHRFDEAETLLKRVNEMGPNAQARYLLGLTHKEQGRLKPAIDNLKIAIDIDPNHEDALFLLGMAYLERNWTRKAEECFAKAMELNPNNLEYQDAIDSMLIAEDGEAGELDRDSEKTLIFAEDLLRQGKLKQALPHYRQLLRKHPDHEDLLTGYAALNFALRRYDETLKIARKLLQLPTAATVRRLAYTLEMEANRAMSLFEDAIDSLHNMADEFPDGIGGAIAGYGLAITKADLGQDLRQAEEDARRALRLSPPEFRHNALDALGWVLSKQGRLEEALEILEQALSMNESVNHLYHYGMVLLALNLKEEAFKIFERTVKLRNRNTTSVEDYIFSLIHSEPREQGVLDSQVDEEP